MKKRLISFAAMLMAVLMLCAVNVFAEPDTDDVPPYTEVPDVSNVPTEPVYTTAPPIATTGPSYTDPYYTEPTTESYVENTTEFVRPTENYEDYPPATNSQYSATNSLIETDEYKGKAEKWNNIDEKDIIALKGDVSEGAISFKDLKNNNGGDENEFLFLILGIVCVVIGTIGAGVFIYTFVKPKHKTAKAAASAEGRRSSQKKRNTTTVRSTGERTRRRHDDYNDGY